MSARLLRAKGSERSPRKWQRVPANACGHRANGMHWRLQAAWQRQKTEATRVWPQGFSAQMAAKEARADGSEAPPRKRQRKEPAQMAA